MSLTICSSLRKVISMLKTKNVIFLNLKSIVNVFPDDIHIVPSGSNKQTNNKKFVDSEGTINFDESESTTQIKEMIYR